MPRCKWCEKELSKPIPDFPTITYCNFYCMNMYETYNIRKSLFDFAQAMEKVMQEKDKLGYENKSRSIQYLEDKLHEERDEVDECFINNDINKFINEESLHEGIMLALLRYRLKEEKMKEDQC